MTSAAPDSERLRLAADIGGTFTDVAAFDEGTRRLLLGKSLSTPRAMVEGIEAGVAKAGTAFSEAGLFLHGSTVAINTMLERTGAKTALITTRGFRDVYEIGRINRPDAYNLFFQKHLPLVPREHCYEVTERLFADGRVCKPLDENELIALAETLKREKIEAVAILFLHCYRNPAHELRAKEILQQQLPNAFISASHELSQEYREFERCSTVVANAFVGPRVQRYLTEIGERITGEGFKGTFLVVQSTGGLFELEKARNECIRILESGPASGVIGTQALCHALGMDNAIAFDMGGTTAKAGVILNGRALTTGHALIGSYDRALPIQVATIDIFEVGTGGGSIARVEHGDALYVGPRSAGAEPGPACYGRGGTEPTITDANLLLGRLGADRFLGGEMKLDVAAAERAMTTRVAQPLGLSTTEAANGILRIAATKMSYAVKGVTTERGLDAGSFALVAYGGAGPLHATAVAREIGIRKVIIPRAPGHFSAFGMLFSDLRYDFVRTWFISLDDLGFEEFEAVYRELEKEGREAIAASAISPREVTVQRALDMRYIGQEHFVTVEIPQEHFERHDRAAIKELFDTVHAQRYGTSAPSEPAEIASLRTTVTGIVEKPGIEKIARGKAAPPKDAHTGTRKAFFPETGFVETPTFARGKLLADNRIEGPALIEEHASTTVARPGESVEVDAIGNLVISISGSTAMSDRKLPVDPVLVEIVRNGVMAVTEEMKINLMRTAYNMIIYEALDFTVGIFTRDGETVSIGLGLPMFIRGMSETVKAKIRHFGADGFSPDDILLTNDAYTTGSHLNHLTFTVPIFHKSRLVGFACCMAHWPDVGGTLGGVTTDIYSEGLQIPIVKYARAGVVNQEIHEIIRMNVRLPERAMGDLRAQVTAIKTGERRFLELLDRYGQEPVLDCIRVLMDHAEVAARERTRAIPDGVYEAESFMDDDAVDVEKRIPIRVKVIVSGDEMTVDLTEVAKQVKGFYNSGPTTGIACAQVAFKCVTSPTDYPVNDGSFRNLKVVLPPGSIVSAVRPAPMRWWMTFPMTVVDTIFKALSKAIPNQVIAGHHADLCVALLDGFYADTRKLFITSFGPLGGGWGAKRGEDGVSATVCINDGDTHNSPNEQFEAKYPVMIESLSLITDSGGPGRYRGGLGVETVVQALTDFNVNTSIERAVCLPWGLEGGLEGTGNEMLMRRDGVIHDDVPNAKVFRAGVKAGDAFVLRSGGGGGFGSPLDRPAKDVQHDVQQGYVSLDAARDYYGVVLDPDALAIDDAATERQRSQLIDVHRKRAAQQSEPPRKIDRKTLDTMPPGHLPIRCLLPSCCGRWHMPRGFEAVEVAP